MLTVISPGHEIVPGFRLERRLGSGSVGEVWVGRGSGGVQVAIKTINDLSRVLSNRELRALRDIREVRHPNLCPLFGIWFFDDQGVLLDGSATDSLLNIEQNRPGRFAESLDTLNVDLHCQDSQIELKAIPKASRMVVAMGLGEQTLKDRLLQVREEKLSKNASSHAHLETIGIDRDELMRYMRGAASAIDELNLQYGIYHCDIKPENLLLVGGHAQVCDFGLAKRVEQDAEMTAIAMGTPAYCAPEMLLDHTYSENLDQYSLAITYYKLRTGDLPFDAKSPSAMVRQKATGKIDLKRVSAAEAGVLKRATNFNPQLRYPSCRSFIAALERAHSHHVGNHFRTLAIASVALLIPVMAITAAIGSRRPDLEHQSTVYQAAHPPVEKSRFPEAKAISEASTLKEVPVITHASGESNSPFHAEYVTELAMPAPTDSAELNLERQAEILNLPNFDDELLKILSSSEALLIRLHEITGILNALAANRDSLSDATFESLVQVVDDALGEPAHKDTLQFILDISERLIQIAEARFGENSDSVARIMVTRLSAGLALKDLAQQEVPLRHVQSVRSRFTDDGYEFLAKSSVAALLVAESWRGPFEIGDWDHRLALSDLARAHRLTHQLGFYGQRMQNINRSHLVALLALRANSKSLSSLNELTLDAVSYLQGDRACSNLAIAASQMALDGSNSLAQNFDPAQVPDLPEAVRSTYHLGIGWNHWRLGEYRQALAEWQSAAMDPWLTESTAVLDRHRVAETLIDHFGTLAELSESNSEMVQYSDNLTAAISTVDVIERLAGGEARLITALNQQRLLAFVAGDHLDEASEILNSLESEQPLEQWINPPLAEAIFKLSLQHSDVGQFAVWGNRLLLAANTRIDSAPLTDHQFVQLHLPVMEKLRPLLIKMSDPSAKAQILVAEQVTKFCHSFVRHTLAADRRAANYKTVGAYYQDLELASAVAALYSSNPQDSARLTYLAATSFMQAVSEDFSSLSVSELLAQLMSYRELALSKGSETYLNLLDAMIAQEMALHDSDRTSAAGHAMRAIEILTNVAESDNPPRLRGDAYRHLAQLKHFLSALKLDSKSYSIEEIARDARAAETYAVDPSHREIAQQVKAELFAIMIMESEFDEDNDLRERLLQEAMQSIEMAIANRKSIGAPFGSLAIKKLRVLWGKTIISPDHEDRENAKQTAIQWLEEVSRPRSNQLWELDVPTMSANMKSYWHFFVGGLLLQSGEEQLGRSHIEAGYSIASKELRSSEQIHQVLTISLADTKFRELKARNRQNPSRTAFTSEVAEIRRLLDGINDPPYLLRVERDRWLDELYKYEEERNARNVPTYQAMSLPTTYAEPLDMRTHPNTPSALPENQRVSQSYPRLRTRVHEIMSRHTRFRRN